MATNRFEMPVRYDSLNAPIIQMRGIAKTFHTSAGDTTVLRGVDADVAQGQFVGVVGRSGSGKSTLVNMITGIDHPSAGTVDVGGVHLQNMPESTRAVWRGKNLGIVFQFFQLLPMLTLIENVMLPMDFCNMYAPASREERALDLLRQVGLEKLAYKLPGAVAGGQQQSAAVARALANDPPILIADEPTGNLDSNTAEQVIGIFEELAAQGKTILIVTHDRGLAQRTNRLLLISDGELVNEHLASAFPDASHALLLRLSKVAVPIFLPVGALLPAQTEMGSSVYLLTRGALLYEKGGEMRTVGVGDIFDPLSTRRTSHAGEAGASLLALPREQALPLMPGAQPVDGELPLPLRAEKIHPLYNWFQRARRVR